MLRTPRRQSGFTLIEIMIVVMIIAILSAIAIPQYQQYVTRSKFTEATNTLSAMRASMEQYYQDNRVYACPGTPPPLPVPPGNLRYFTFTCTLQADANGTANQAYQLEMQGNAGSAVQGFNYFIDNQNNKWTQAPANWGGNQANCWTTNKGGC